MRPPTHPSIHPPTHPPTHSTIPSKSSHGPLPPPPGLPAGRGGRAGPTAAHAPPPRVLPPRQPHALPRSVNLRLSIFRVHFPYTHIHTKTHIPCTTQPRYRTEGSDFVSRRVLRPIYRVTSALATSTAQFEARRIRLYFDDDDDDDDDDGGIVEEFVVFCFCVFFFSFLNDDARVGRKEGEAGRGWWWMDSLDETNRDERAKAGSLSLCCRYRIYASPTLEWPTDAYTNTHAHTHIHTQMRYGLLSRHGERFAKPNLEGGSLESLSLGVEEVRWVECVVDGWWHACIRACMCRCVRTRRRDGRLRAVDLSVGVRMYVCMYA
jgi:hypothetical protein